MAAFVPAAFVPAAFSVSLPVPAPLFKELHVRKPGIMGLHVRKPGIVGTLPIHSIPRTVMMLLTSRDSNRSISTNRIHHYHSVECSTRHLRESVSFYSNVGLYFTNIVLAGYWVGPDIDDGWGFIEAFVDRIA